MKEFIIELDHNYLFNAYNYDLLKYDSLEEKLEYFKKVKDEDYIIEPEYIHKSNELLKVVLNVSNKCNLHCQYCYANHGNYGRQEATMNPEIIYRIIDDLITRGIRKIGIVSFFGGEPLINKDIITLGLNLFNKNFEVNKYEVTTNGTLIDQKILETFKKYNVLLNISLDGPQDINDYLRGKNTYIKIIEVIKNARKINYENLVISCTFTNKHLEFGYSFKDLEDFFNNLGIRYNISPVVTSIKDLKLNLEDTQSTSDIKKEIINSIDAILENKKNYFITPYVHDILYPLINNTRSYTFCDELYTSLSLNYDYNGDIYNCFRFWGNESFICKDNEIIVDDVRLINIKDNHSECKSCWARFFCGVCIADIIEENLSMPYSNKSCERRNIYEYTINKIVDKIDINHKNLDILIKNFPNYIFY